MDHRLNSRRYVIEQSGSQAQTTYEDYLKIKSFNDVGFFLQSYVNTGGEVTRDATYNNVINVTAISASLGDNVLARDAESFRTSTPITTYYLDFGVDGDWHWGTAHPAGVAGTNYLSIAEVTTDPVGNVVTVTDRRGEVGGLRLKSEFGLEDYASIVQMTHIATDVENFKIQVPEADDTQRIQRAIDAAETNGSGVVLLPSKTYIVSSTISLRSNVSLLGQNGTIVKVNDSCPGFYAMFSIKSVENVSISGITYDGNYDRENYDISERPEIAVYIVDSTNVRITDNNFITCGIWTISCEVSASFPYNDGVYIERNTINYRVGKNTKTPDLTGMTVDTTQMYVDVKNYWVRDNIITTEEVTAETAIEAHRRNGTVSGNIITGFSNGVLIVPGFYEEDSEAARINVYDNKMYHVRKGITLWQVPVRDLDDVHITNNTIELDPSRFSSVQESKGILLLDTLPGNNNGKMVKNVLISDNIIKFEPFTEILSDSDYVINFVGISLRSWVSIENIKVANNQVINAPATGILIGVSGNATYLNTATGLVVEENTIINAGISENISSQPFNPRCAIRVNGSGVSNVEKSTVRNNKIIDNKSVGSFFTAPTYLVAYNLDTCTIANNPILANGFESTDMKRTFTMNWMWDSQTGTPTITRSANYIKQERIVKVFATLEITSMANFTQGFGSYLTLPITPVESRQIPVVVTNHNSATSKQWFLDVVSGTRNAYIRGINADNTLTVLAQSGVKVGTKVSVSADYLV